MVAARGCAPLQRWSGHSRLIAADCRGLTVTTEPGPECSTMVGRAALLSARIVRFGNPSRVHGVAQRLRKLTITRTLSAPGVGAVADPASWAGLQRGAGERTFVVDEALRSE